MAVPGALRRATLQSAALNIASTILAQLIKAYRTGITAAPSSTFNPVGLNIWPILQFLAWCLIATPPNFWWQEFLEAEFPGREPGEPVGDGKEKVEVGGPQVRTAHS